MENKKEWYIIEGIEELDSPSLIVFPERVRYNIRLAISMVENPSYLRPHIKTHKSPDVIRLMLEAGITKFKCATISEAEILGLCNAPDVLLAYQPTGPKLRRFVQLIKKYPATTYSCLTDNEEGAKEQSEFFSQQGLRVPVFIDLNIGMGRTGLEPGKAAVQLYQFCNSCSGIIPVGLHAYDGHIKNIDVAQRKRDCDTAFDPVKKLKEDLVKLGFPDPLVIAGGSHTFPFHARRKEVEASPGTFVYWDKSNSENCPDQPFLTAAMVVTRVVSLPAPGRVCIDLGHKSIAAENELTRRVYLVNAPELKAVSQSEEHLVLEANPDHCYHPGDVLYGIPYHVCPTIALYESAITVENNCITGAWSNTARDRKITV